jgi:hypothetical protein
LASPAKDIGGINQALWEALHGGKVNLTEVLVMGCLDDQPVLMHLGGVLERPILGSCVFFGHFYLYLRHGKTNIGLCSVIL